MTLVYLTIAFILGLLLGQWSWQTGRLGCDIPSWAWLIAALLLPLTLFLRQAATSPNKPDQSLRWPVSAGFEPPRPRVSTALIVALLLCIAMGLLRYAADPLFGCRNADALSNWNLAADAAFDRSARAVTIHGYVDNFPVVDDDRQALVIRVEQLVTDLAQFSVEGRVHLLTSARPRFVYGTPIAATGRLVEPPVFDDFSYRDYLARQGVNSLLHDPEITQLTTARRGPIWQQRLADLRQRGVELLQRSLSEPYAALAAGILLGVDAIPDHLYERFNATGTSHVLVISGSNVALIAAALALLSRRLVGRWSVPVTLIGIALYAFFVGGEPSVWRAALMGSLVVMALAVGRRSSALVSLAAAVWLMTLIDPHVLWDVGFQLSAVATVGLVLYAPPMMAWLSQRWPAMGSGLWDPTGAQVGVQLRALISEIVVLSLAANLLTMPLIVYHFARLSLFSLGVNLLIVPLQPLILASGTMGLAVGLVGAEWLAQGLFWAAWVGLFWTERVVSFASQIPGASVAVDGFGVPALLGLYALFLGLLMAVQTEHPWVERLAKSLSGLRLTHLTDGRSLSALGLTVILVWTGITTLPDGRLHVYFLDVGQGDGIFVQTPGGRQLLIDGGAGEERLLTQLGEVMPFWDRSIDVLLLTHPDRDHMGAQIGLPQRYQIDLALDTTAGQANPDAEPWRAALAQAQVPVTLMYEGGWLDLGNGVALWVFWPPPDPITGSDSDNENSLVTKLVYGDFSVLLTGDAGLASEAEWLAADLPLEATVLKVGHHGSANSTGRAFVEAVDPTYAVIQVGPNAYGHPTEIVLETLAGRTIYRNDQDGRIHMVSDGEEVWVTTSPSTE